MVRLLVVGWDGASYDHLQRIKTPFFDSLDVKGRLLPEKVYQGIPIDSGTAWTTITTGLKVEQHGFLSINNKVESRKFLKFTKRLAEIIPSGRIRTYLYYGLNKAFNISDRTPRSHDVPYKRLWDYIDGKTLTLGVPLTYPAWEHNGVMFSGIPAPIEEPSKSDVYPERLRWLREEYNGYYYVEGESPLESEEQRNLEEYRNNIYIYNDRAFGVVEELCESMDFELVFAVFPVIDDLLHSVDADEEKEKLEKAYRWIDERTQELVERIDPDEVLIISDHGMMPSEDSLNPSLYPGTLMDHDSMNGIWASDHDFGFSLQEDVTPGIYEFLTGEEFVFERKEFGSDGDKDFEEISV